jgi:hypothetical protein
LAQRRYQFRQAAVGVAVIHILYSIRGEYLDWRDSESP